MQTRYRIVIGLLFFALLSACGSPSATTGSAQTHQLGRTVEVVTSTTSDTPSAQVNHPSPTLAVATTIVSPLATATPQDSKLLGAALDGIALRVEKADILQKLGKPQLETISHGLGTPRWEYQDGLVISFDPDTVWQIIARPPFQGATSEGFKLGDTKDTFRIIYKGFSILAPQANQLAITDRKGIYLDVLFDENGIAKMLVLEDTECTSCTPTTPIPGTPGPGKGP